MLTDIKLKTIERGSPFGALLWERAGTPIQLQMNVDSGGNGHDPKADVLSFLKTYGQIWYLDVDTMNIQISPIEAAQPKLCESLVSVTLINGDLPVYNATIVVSLHEGSVRSVVGKMDGRRETQEYTPASIEAKQAAQVAAKAKDWPDETIAIMTEFSDQVVYDPFFVDGRTGGSSASYNFRAPEWPRNAGLVVNGSTGVVEVSTLGLADDSVLDPSDCNGSSSVWHAVVADDSNLATPAWLSFREVGGLRTNASDPALKVIEMMGLPEVRATIRFMLIA